MRSTLYNAHRQVYAYSFDKDKVFQIAAHLFVVSCVKGSSLNLLCISFHFVSFWYQLWMWVVWVFGLGCYTPITKVCVCWGWGLGGSTGIILSVWLSFCVSGLCPGDIFWTIKNFVTKLGMVVYHHAAECHVKKIVCYLPGQGHSEGLHHQNMNVSTISSELMILLHPNLVWW